LLLLLVRGYSASLYGYIEEEEKMGRVQIHTSYFIYATPRSGSYLLCEALASTGLAGKPNEYFNASWMKTLRKRESFIQEANWLTRLKQVGTTPNGVFGAKVIWFHFEDLIDFLREIPGHEKVPVQLLLETCFPNLHAIWIRRRDTVRQAVSYAKALQTRAWVQLHGRPTPWHRELFLPEFVVNTLRRPRTYPTGEATFNFQLIDRLVQSIVEDEEEMQRYFTQSGIEPLIVVYEDFVQAYEETALRILDFLGIAVPPDLVFGPRLLQKQANAQSEDWVQRYYQLKLQHA
jgi:LPS sulfotransferase NodH